LQKEGGDKNIIIKRILLLKQQHMTLPRFNEASCFQKT